MPSTGGHFSICCPSSWPGEWIAVLSLSLTLQLPALAIQSSGVSGTHAQAELFSAGVGVVRGLGYKVIPGALDLSPGDQGRL